MKRAKLTFLTLLIFVLASSAFAKDINMSRTIVTNQDSLLQYFSLFHESHKNKDFLSSLEPGWIVINADPTNFIKYKIFKKMEESITAIYEDEATPEEEKIQLADTLLYMFDKAIEYDKEKAGYYHAKKGYILHTWHEAEPAEIIAEYEKGIELDAELPDHYRDLLGSLYIQNMSDDNDYQMKGFELYSNLQQKDPNNQVWNDRLRMLAGGDIDKLLDIKKKSWEIDKDNVERAWDYASTCIRAKNYEKAIEALEFLVERSPDVVNYWSQLANAYQKIGNNDGAIKANKELITLQPDNKDSYLNIAIIYKELGQLSVARSYLQKASNIDPEWSFPVFIEGNLYEDAGRSVVNSKGGKVDFMDKCVFQLAVDTYNRASKKTGNHAAMAAQRAKAFENAVPSQEDFFFKKYNAGDEIKIEGDGYEWINRSIKAK